MQNASYGEFEHKYFLRDHPELLMKISRKAHSNNANSSSAAQPKKTKSRVVGGGQLNRDASIELRDPLDYIDGDDSQLVRRDPQAIADSIHSFTAESDALLTELLHHRVLANDFERRLRELEYWNQQRHEGSGIVDEELKLSGSLVDGLPSSSSAMEASEGATKPATDGKVDLTTAGAHQNAHDKLEYENQLMKNLVVESINKQAIMHDKMEKVISLLCKVYSSSGIAGSMNSGLKAQLNSIIAPSSGMESSPTAISSASKSNNCSLLLENCPSGAAVAGLGPPFVVGCSEADQASTGAGAGADADAPLGIQIPPSDAAAGPGTALLRQGSISKMSDENFYNLCDFLQLDTPMTNNANNNSNSKSLFDAGEDANGSVIGGQLLSNQPSLPSFAIEPDVVVNPEPHVVGGGALQKRYSSFENSINSNVMSPPLSRQDSINNNSVLSSGGPGKHREKLTFDPHMPSILPRAAKSRSSSINDIDEDSLVVDPGAVGISFEGQGGRDRGRSGSIGSRSSSINAPDDASRGSVHSRDSDESLFPNPKRMRWDPTAILASTPGPAKEIAQEPSEDFHPEKVNKISKSQEVSKIMQILLRWYMSMQILLQWYMSFVCFLVLLLFITIIFILYFIIGYN